MNHERSPVNMESPVTEKDRFTLSQDDRGRGGGSRGVR